MSSKNNQASGAFKSTDNMTNNHATVSRQSGRNRRTAKDKIDEAIRLAKTNLDLNEDGDRYSQINECRDKIRNFILNDAKGEQKYRQLAVEIFDKIDFPLGVLRIMVKDIESKTFQTDDSKYFTSRVSHRVGESATPYNDMEPPTGIPIHKAPPFTGMKMQEVVLDGDPTRLPGVFACNGKDAQNPHLDYSKLKRAFACQIALPENDFCAVPLCMQRFLCHDGKGPIVITGAFVTNLLVDHMPRIQELGIPVIVVTQSYSPGFHFGTQTCYYCDESGRVIGVSNGNEYCWRDLSDPYPAFGTVGEYTVRTQAIHGPQRIAVFAPGHHRGQDIPLNLVHEQAYKGKNTLKPPKTPTSLIGLYDMETPPDDPTRNNLYFTPKVLLDTEEPKNIVQKIVEYAQDPKRWATHAIALATAIALKHAGDMLATTPLYKPEEALVPRHHVGNSLAATWLFVKYTVDYLERKYCTINVKLRLIPLLAHGEYKDKFMQYYMANPISSSGLPYGYYKCSKYSIIQVGQFNDGANYTNVPELVLRFCNSHRMAATNAPLLYDQLMCTTTPVVVWPKENNFQAQVPSAVKRFTSAAPYRINITDKPAESIKLFNDENFREFAVGTLDRKAAAFTASTRVVGGGLCSQYTEQEHFTLYQKFWHTYTDKRNPVLPPDPDLSNYHGKKRRLYEKWKMKIGIAYEQAVYTSFAKIEALPIATIIKKGIRLITMNSKLFNVLHKNFFHWFETTLLSFADAYGKLYAKGSNLEERFLMISKLCLIYQYVIPIDLKRFDSSHRNQAYTACMKFYGYLGLAYRVVQNLISAKTYGLIEHDMPLRRSGDLFTGCGNCLVVGSLLHQFPGIRMYCDGDDTLIFTNNPGVINEIKYNLATYGYQVTNDDPVMLYTLDRQGKVCPTQYEFEFCHVYYRPDGYWIDRKRLLNRLGNIATTSLDAAANTILGKLQALSNLEAVGVDFGFPVRSLIRMTDADERTNVVRELYSNTEHLLIQDGPCLVDLTDPNTGMIARIVSNIRLENLYLRYLNDRWWRRRILSIIKRELITSREAQARWAPDYYTKLKKWERRITELGFDAIAPVMDEAYKNMFVEMFDLNPVIYDAPPFIHPTRADESRTTFRGNIPIRIQLKSSNVTFVPSNNCMVYETGDRVDESYIASHTISEPRPQTVHPKQDKQ